MKTTEQQQERFCRAIPSPGGTFDAINHMDAIQLHRFKYSPRVLQAVLQELKHDTNDHAHPPVPNHQRLRAGKARKVVSRIPPVGVGHIAGGQRCESERVAGQAYLDIPPQEVSRDKAVHLVLSGGKGGGRLRKTISKMHSTECSKCEILFVVLFSG